MSLFIRPEDWLRRATSSQNLHIPAPQADHTCYTTSLVSSSLGQPDTPSRQTRATSRTTHRSSISALTTKHTPRSVTTAGEPATLPQKLLQALRLSSLALAVAPLVRGLPGVHVPNGMAHRRGLASDRCGAPSPEYRFFASAAAPHFAPSSHQRPTSRACTPLRRVMHSVHSAPRALKPHYSQIFNLGTTSPGSLSHDSDLINLGVASG